MKKEVRHAIVILSKESIMARTIRRRKAKFNYSKWVLCDLVRDPGGFFKWVAVDRHSTEGQRKLARYHGDAGFGDYGHARQSIANIQPRLAPRLKPSNWLT